MLVLNKSAGLVCSRRDPEGRSTIFEQLPRLQGGRWITVGRLDIQTTGLLLVTNDGALAHRMMHPSTGLDREYAVRVNKKLEDSEIAQLKAGVEIEGETMRFSDIRFYNGSDSNFWYHVALLEGRNREVRRLFDSAGCTVSRLKRFATARNFTLVVNRGALGVHGYGRLKSTLQDAWIGASAGVAAEGQTIQGR